MFLLAVLVVAVLIVLILAVLLLVTVLILVLVIHDRSSDKYLLGFPSVVCPEDQLLSFGRKIKLTANPATIAAVIPPAVDLSPPVKMPIKPSLSTASRTPFASV